MKKLYEIPRGSKIKLYAPNGDSEIATFHHLDGMYSYCTLEGGHGGTIHLSALTPLSDAGDYYVIDTTHDEEN